MSNKHIHRNEGSTKIFDSRTLDRDYRTLRALLRPGMSVLDVGCSTGAITKDVARAVYPGNVTGIDNTAKFIVSGKETYAAQDNLTLQHTDLFEFKTEQRYDLVVAARVLQWLNNPLEAVQIMKGLTRPGGFISVLDYDHEAIEWDPGPPAAMRTFYSAFLSWRNDAGMNNHIARDLPAIFHEAGISDIEALEADEHYTSDQTDFKERAAIWIKVASSTQMVDEGYINDKTRLTAIDEYRAWIDGRGRSMTMKLTEVRGRV